jgi:hypothetical protein
MGCSLDFTFIFQKIPYVCCEKGFDDTNAKNVPKNGIYFSMSIDGSIIDIDLISPICKAWKFYFSDFSRTSSAYVL